MVSRYQCIFGLITSYLFHKLWLLRSISMPFIFLYFYMYVFISMKMWNVPNHFRGKQKYWSFKNTENVQLAIRSDSFR